MRRPKLPKDQATREPSKSIRFKRRGSSSAIPFWRLIRPRVGWKRIVRDLWNQINKDAVMSSAAVLAYFSMLSIFPAAILLLSLLPYLPIPDLEANIIGALHQAMPQQTAELLTSTVTNVVHERRGGLLSLSILGTVWAASSGLQAVMQQLHSMYDTPEKRPYWKRRLIAIGLVFAVGVLVVGAFALVIVGNILHEHMIRVFGENALFPYVFLLGRWAVSLLMMLGALSLLFYFGPNVRQRYRLITPGGLVATVLSIVSSLLFRTYVEHFGSYEAMYGSLGAAIVLLLWLYVGSFVVLLGAEVNGLFESYARRKNAPLPQ